MSLDNPHTQHIETVRVQVAESACESRLNTSRGEAEGRGATAPLGIYPKSVGRSGGKQRVYTDKEKLKEINENKRLESRRQLYSDLKSAAMILREDNPEKLHAVAKCRWCAVSYEVQLHLKEVGDHQHRASYRGLKVCGNVWGCPVCSARISQHRRQEMNTALAWSREHRFVPVMLTLTARHGADDQLLDLLDKMKLAKRLMRGRRDWKRLKERIVGSVTATEITHGRNGWHPHFHEILLIDAADEKEAIKLVKPLASAWRASLARYGLDGNDAAFNVQGAAAAGDYVTKWGAAEEVTLGNAKTGRTDKRGHKGKTPRELLRLASEGDEYSKKLWLEYFAATSRARRRQLVWSPGLKEMVGIADVEDEEIAEEVSDCDEPELIKVWTSDDWREVRAKRVRIMEAAERGGKSAVEIAVHGPDDENDIFCVIEDSGG